MDFFSKIVLAGIGVSVLVNFSVFGARPCPCDATEKDVENLQAYDICDQPGIFKSKSICYTNRTNGVTLPYEYFVCLSYGGEFLMYQRDCRLSTNVVFDDAVSIGLRVFNPYDELDGFCNSKPEASLVVRPPFSDLSIGGPCPINPI